MSPLERAQLSLKGLCLGDSFGAQFFFGRTAAVESMIAKRLPPMGRWSYTDDTAMAFELVKELAEHGEVEQDSLALRFAQEYTANPGRGYGTGARRVLQRIQEGVPWSEAAANAFSGKGSLGNGAAMRVAPLGAYFASEPEQAILQAQLSAEVTHTHPEGKAGAVAVALSAALAWRSRGEDFPLLTELLTLLEPGAMKDRIMEAGTVQDLELARALGQGDESRASSTVPLALWCADRFSHSLEEALWAGAQVGAKDRDTVCAIIGGVLALRLGESGFPSWLEQVKVIPQLGG